MSREPKLLALDRQPGSVPDITADARGFVYAMRLVTGRATERLIIRVDNDGEIRIAIAPQASAS